ADSLSRYVLDRELQFARAHGIWLPGLLHDPERLGPQAIQPDSPGQLRGDDMNLPFARVFGNERLAFEFRQPQRAALSMRRVRPEAAKIVSFGEATPALLGAPQGAVVTRQHQSARRGRGHWLFLAYHSLGPPLRLRQLRVRVQDFFKTLRQPVSVFDGPREETASRGHQHQLSAGQPAI